MAENPIAQYTIAQNHQQDLPKNQNKQQPSEREDSKEKETEDSDLKNYQANRILEILSASSGKILWALLNEVLVTEPCFQKIIEPPEVSYHA